MSYRSSDRSRATPEIVPVVADPAQPGNDVGKSGAQRAERKAATGASRSAWLGAAIQAVVKKYDSRLIPASRRIRRPREPSDEVILARIGAVEIRQMPSACVAWTCVNGEPAQARETALKRLVDYLDRNNLDFVRMHAERPIIQQQLGPRRWRIGVRLSTFQAAAEAPTPRAPKVKVQTVEPEFLAVVRVTGRWGYHKVSSADTIVLDAITNSEWLATGAPVIRLHGSGPLGALIGGFEVAVPVVPRHREHEHADRSQLTDTAATRWPRQAGNESPR
jgi:hypothetical protein